jgi:hypothetical protein
MGHAPDVGHLGGPVLQRLERGAESEVLAEGAGEGCSFGTTTWRAWLEARHT